MQITLEQYLVMTLIINSKFCKFKPNRNLVHIGANIIIDRDPVLSTQINRVLMLILEEPNLFRPYRFLFIREHITDLALAFEGPLQVQLHA